MNRRFLHLLALSLAILCFLLVVAGTARSSETEVDSVEIASNWSSMLDLMADSGAMPAILNDIETQVAVIQEPVPTVAEPWRDDFNSDTLDPRWAWLNPEQMNWSLTDRPGYLRIMLEPEPAYLVQYSPSGDYVLETKLDFTPTNNIQRAGLIIRGQNDMSIALLHAYCDFEPPGCPGDGIFFDNATDGSTSGTNYATTIDIQPVMYLRLK